MSLKQQVSEAFPPKPTFTENDLPDLTGTNILITGATSGCGLELARMLYSVNATVVISGRSHENIEKATKNIKSTPTVGKNPTRGHIIPFVIDLSDLPTIKPAVEELRTQLDALDYVFFNAGVMIPPRGSVTKQGHELQWGVHVMGHFLLQRLLYPFVQAGAARKGEARIIWVSSGIITSAPSPDGVFWDDFHGVKTERGQQLLYAQSKAGNVILANETAKRYAADGIVAASLSPGYLKTELQRHFPPLMRKVFNAIAHDARYGALTELNAGFAPGLIDRSSSGSHVIPWGRKGAIPKNLEAGLLKGSGARLWDILEKDTDPYM